MSVAEDVLGVLFVSSTNLTQYCHRYMFRNAEYVLALKELMDLEGKTTMDDYKAAFDRLDKDKDGYIDPSEIQALFDDVYGGKAPSFETDAFMKFFDENNDGRISWDEFENGLGAAMATSMQNGMGLELLQGDDAADDDEEDDDEAVDINTNVSGT